MIIGLGVDMAEIARVQEAIERYGERLLRRLFTPLEIAYCQRHKNCYDRFAARFAAKEAAMKALGTGWRCGVTWHDFEVYNEPGGKPCLRLTGAGLGIYRKRRGTRILLSLTHAEKYALAQVIIEGNSAGPQEERLE